MILNKEELLSLIGGSAISSPLLNAISKLITTLLDWGRAIGSSISRYKNGNYCS